MEDDIPLAGFTMTRQFIYEPVPEFDEETFSRAREILDELMKRHWAVAEAVAGASMLTMPAPAAYQFAWHSKPAPRFEIMPIPHAMFYNSGF